MKNIVKIITFVALSAVTSFALPASINGTPRTVPYDSNQLLQQSPAGNYYSTSFGALRSWMNTGNFDTTFRFADTIATGFTASQVDTVRFTKHGYLVCWRTTAGFSGTSNTTSLALAAFPSLVRPTQTLTVPLGGVVTDSGLANRIGDFQIATTGVVTIRRQTIGTPWAMSATFLGSSTKGIAAGAGGCYLTQP